MTTSKGLAVLAALLATVLAGCSAGAESPPATTKSAAADADGATVAGGSAGMFPGLYVTADVAVVSESTAGIRYASGRSCDDLSTMLASGQWRLVDKLSLGGLGEEQRAMLAGFGAVAGDLLQRGDALAFVAFDGGGACTATVSPVPRSELTLEGTGLPGTATGWATATRCYVSETTGDLTVTVYFDTDSLIGGQGQFSLVKSGDDYVVTADDETAINLLRHDSRFLHAMTAAYGTGRVPWSLELEPGDGFSGTATVAAEGDVPPAGEVMLRGLVDETSDAEFAVGLPFACAGTAELP